MISPMTSLTRFLGHQLAIFVKIWGPGKLAIKPAKWVVMVKFQGQKGSFIESIYLSQFLWLLKLFHIFQLEKDILIFGHFATVLKFMLLFQSTKIDL